MGGKTAPDAFLGLKKYLTFGHRDPINCQQSAGTGWVFFRNFSFAWQPKHIVQTAEGKKCPGADTHIGLTHVYPSEATKNLQGLRTPSHFMKSLASSATKHHQESALDESADSEFRAPPERRMVQQREKNRPTLMVQRATLRDRTGAEIGNSCLRSTDGVPENSICLVFQAFSLRFLSVGPEPIDFALPMNSRRQRSLVSGRYRLGETYEFIKNKLPFKSSCNDFDRCSVWWPFRWWGPSQRCYKGAA